MRTYIFLSKIPFLKKRFTLKVLSVAFVGIHIPLFAVIAYLLISELPKDAAWTIGLTTLIFTLLATAVTLFLLNKLLKPIKMAQIGLKDYVEFSKVPSLPTKYQDEAGELLTAVQQATEDLEHYEEERQKVMQILHHDLQSPIKAALGVLNLLKESNSEHEQQEIMLLLEESLNQQLEQLHFFLNQLKQQSLNSELDTKKEETDLRELIEQILEGFKIPIQQKDLRIHVRSFLKPLKLPKNSLQMVVKNILDNAIRHSDAHGDIEIVMDIQNKVLNITIKDHGCGFLTANSDKIFLYNSNIHSSEVQTEASYGIGMFLSKNTMKKIGGDLKAESEGIGKGATFTITYLLAE